MAERADEPTKKRVRDLTSPRTGSTGQYLGLLELQQRLIKTAVFTGRHENQLVAVLRLSLRELPNLNGTLTPQS